MNIRLLFLDNYWGSNLSNKADSHFLSCFQIELDNVSVREYNLENSSPRGKCGLKTIRGKSMIPVPEELSKMTVAQIDALVETGGYDDSLTEMLSKDPRAGVRAIAKKIISREVKKAELEKKLINFLHHENTLRKEGYALIAGVDEAGCGPLAGPVVAGAVILPSEAVIQGLNDSKKLTPEQRERLYDIITTKAVTWSTGSATHAEIDEIGILKAALLAMRRAVAGLSPIPEIAMIDGNRPPGLTIPERLFVGGDATCYSIAAASILAKVTRDRIMKDMDKIYPGYGFAVHKGYTVTEHVNALKALGPCDIHRYSFSTVTASSPPCKATEVYMRRLRSEDPNISIMASNALSRMHLYLPEKEIAELRTAAGNDLFLEKDIFRR